MKPIPQNSYFLAKGQKREREIILLEEEIRNKFRKGINIFNAGLKNIDDRVEKN